MDSGAYDTVCGEDLIGGNEIKESPMSKAGGTYSGPNGSKIKNKEFTTLEGKTAEGYQLTFRTQVGEGMKQMLISVKNAVNTGNMVVFGASRKALRELADAEAIQENMIKSKKTKRVSKINEKSGAYTYPKTITRRKKQRKNTKSIEKKEFLNCWQLLECLSRITLKH